MQRNILMFLCLLIEEKGQWTSRSCHLFFTSLFLTKDPPHKAPELSACLQWQHSAYSLTKQPWTKTEASLSTPQPSLGCWKRARTRLCHLRPKLILQTNLIFFFDTSHCLLILEEVGTEPNVQLFSPKQAEMRQRPTTHSVKVTTYSQLWM